MAGDSMTVPRELYRADLVLLLDWRTLLLQHTAFVKS